MTKYTKTRCKNETESRENKLSNTTCRRNNKGLKNNSKLLKHKCYFGGNKIHDIKEGVQKELLFYNAGNNEEKCMLKSKQNGNIIDSECKEPYQIALSYHNKELNNISKSKNHKTKLHHCNLCTDYFCNKKTLNDHKKKFHIKEISIKSKQNGKKEESEEKVLESFREKCNVNEAFDNLSAKKIIQKNLQNTKIQSYEQASKVLRSKKVELKPVKNKISRKKNTDKKNVKHICYEHGHSEESQMSFSNLYKETSTDGTKLKHHINNSKKQNLTHSSEKRVITRSITRRRILEESLKNSTSSDSVPDVLEMKIIESRSEFLLKNSNDQKKLNKAEHKTTFERSFRMTTRFHNRSNNAVSCKLCNSTYLCNKMSKENQNEDHCTPNVASRRTNMYNSIRKNPQQKPLKLQENENILQSTLQSNLSKIVDTKLKTNYNISRQFANEGKYRMNKFITIGKTVYGKMKPKEITESECQTEINKNEQHKNYNTLKKDKHDAIEIVDSNCFGRTLRKRNSKDSKISIIQPAKSNTKINKNLKRTRNLVSKKKLIVPLIKVEHLPSSELSQLLKNSNYLENKARNERQTVYQTSNIVQVQYRNTEIRTNQEICMENESLKQRPNSRLSQKIDTCVKTIDFVSIHQYNGKKLEKKIEENKSESNILNSQINDKVSVCGMSSNTNINNRETLETSTPKLLTAQLEDVLNFFLQHKKNTVNKSVKRKSQINNLKKFQNRGVRKNIALCIKCKQVFNLLLQFSDKMDFIKDEKLCIECTLCGLQIYALSHFQQHIMDLHLQCERISVTKKKQFPVDILTLNEHFSSNNKFIFECCCCLKVYNHMKCFKNHIEKVHQNFYYSMNDTEKCGEKQVIQTSQMYRIFDVINNVAKISEQDEKSVIQTNDQIDKYFNTKEINFKNNICYTNSNEVKRSSVTHITQEISTSKTNTKVLNNENEYSDLNNTSNISLTTESEFSNSVSNKSNKGHKSGTFLYVCNICFKRYKRKHTFLLHTSKHSTSSDTDINEKLKIQEISKDNNVIKFENNTLVSSIHTEDLQNHFNNSKDNNVLNSVEVNKDLEEPKCNILTSKGNSKEINSVRNENIKHIAKNENIILNTDNTLDCNYLLHINFTQKSRRGIKRQKSIKFNINIIKKCKMDDTGQEGLDNGIKNKLPISYTENSNLILNTNKNEVVTYVPKEMHCNICDKKFNSQRVLKEHMFFLHDSIFEGTELSNFLSPYFNKLYNLETVSAQSIDRFRKEYNIQSKRKMLEMLMKKNNKVHERIISKIVNKNNTIERNRKWRCNPCKENFALIRNYLRHKYYCHNDESVVHICDNCNKVLTSVAMVNIHICTNVSSWNCRRCNLTFTNGISLTQHNISHHFETAGPHVCDVCKLSFLTMYMLQKHKSTHSLIDNSNNINNFIDFSVENDGLHNLNNTNSSNIELSEEKIQLVNDKGITSVNKNTKDVNGTNEATKVSLETCMNSNVISLPCDDDELFKCKLCNILCLTKIQLKIHFEKWHNIKVEMCQLCNNLYLLDKITKHLISRHIILDDSNLKEDNITIQTRSEKMKDFENDIVKILGLKRLLSIYEYQRFDSISESKCFNCMTCLKEFSNVQSYKIHYLKCHDTMCVLCNIEFKHSFQAFIHKLKIHMSIDLYLWVIHKVTSAILQFNKHGSNMEDIILRYSEIRTYDKEKHFTNIKEHNSIESFEMEISEYFWSRNYKLEKLDTNKELLYVVERFKSSTELSENVNTSIIIIDHSNYKNSSVLNNCELNA